MAADGEQQLFDDAMDKYGGNEWSFSMRALPLPRDVAVQADSITFQQFAQGALRDAHQVKTISILVDYVTDLPGDIDTSKLAEQIGEGQCAELPMGIRPAKSLPKDTKLSLVVNKTSNKASVVKSFFFQKPLQKKDAIALAVGKAYVPVFRPGPWAWKKAYQSLVDRLPGQHVDWAWLRQKDQADGNGGSKWKPSADELRPGIAYINKNCPPGNSENEQLLWILTHIKADDGNPIAGWPEKTVAKAAANKASANGAADPERFFPLTVYDLKPVWSDFLLPLLYPLLVEFGIMFLGWPGVGKTPTVVILSMAMGRYHKRTKECGEPGWRRGKMMDNFRNRPGEVQEAVFLDDPTLSCLDVSDLKNFLDVGESATSNSRYSPAKFTRNQLWAVCDNEFNEEDEPEPDSRIQITTEEFYKVAQKAFGYARKPHVMAVLKRAICGIAGKHAFYLRLPSQSEDVPIFRITVDEINKDWLVNPGNKWAYSEYKRGNQVYYENFEDNVTREQNAIDEGFENIRGKSPRDYIASVNEKILNVLRSRQAQAEEGEPREDLSQAASPRPGEIPLVHIPNSPEPSQPQSVVQVPLGRDGSWMIPRATTGPSSSKRARFFSDFQIRRRIRFKSPGRNASAASSSSVSRGASGSGAAVSNADACRAGFDDPEAVHWFPGKEDDSEWGELPQELPSEAGAFDEPPQELPSEAGAFDEPPQEFPAEAGAFDEPPQEIPAEAGAFDEPLQGNVDNETLQVDDMI